MKKIIPLITFLLAWLSISYASADESQQLNNKIKAHVYLDKNLTNNNGVDGYNLHISFIEYNKNVYKDSIPYKVVIRLWNEPSCHTPFPQYDIPYDAKPTPYEKILTYDLQHTLDKDRTVFIPFNDLSSFMEVNHLFHGNWVDRERVFYQIGIFRPQDKDKPWVLFYPKEDPQTFKWSAYFDYRIANFRPTINGQIDSNDDPAKLTKEIAKHPGEAAEAADNSGTYVKVSYLPFDGKRFTPLSDFEIRLSFFRGEGERKKPLKFYELQDDFDKYGNHRYYYSKGQWNPKDYENECIEYRSEVVNYMRRTRHDWNSFDILVPNVILNYAGFDFEDKNLTKDEKNKVSVFVDLYTKGGTLINEGTYYQCWERTGYIETQSSDCAHLDRDTVSTVILEQERLSQTEVWMKYKHYIICRTCHYEFERTEEKVEFRPLPPCPPHNWIEINVEKEDKGTDNGYLGHTVEVHYTYKCTKCGIYKVEDIDEKHSHEPQKQFTTCLKGRAKLATIKGVPIKLYLATSKEDSTAIYVAETKMSKELWAMINPYNYQNWKRGDKDPVVDLSQEEVTYFLSSLNGEMKMKNLPLEFVIPTKEEWNIAYKQYGKQLHMDEGLKEMCKNSDAENLTNTATSPSKASGTTIRLFAKPILGDDGLLEEIKDPIFIGDDKIIKIGDYWVVRNLYECKICHRPIYGNCFTTSDSNGKIPFVCRKKY